MSERCPALVQAAQTEGAPTDPVCPSSTCSGPVVSAQGLSLLEPSEYQKKLNCNSPVSGDSGEDPASLFPFYKAARMSSSRKLQRHTQRAPRGRLGICHFREGGRAEQRSFWLMTGFHSLYIKLTSEKLDTYDYTYSD